MKTISAAALTDTVAQLCIKANASLPQDVAAALVSFRQAEPWPLAKETLGLLEDNLTLAKEKNLPICQDTGMACVFVELGQDVHMEGDFEQAIHEGVRQGYGEGVTDPKGSVTVIDVTARTAVVVDFNTDGDL